MTDYALVVGIEQVHTKAASSFERPAPGGGPGSLTIIDNRTGKKYEIKVSLHPLT